MYICSAHFRPQDLRQTALKSFLTAEAIPTLHLCKEEETDFCRDSITINQTVDGKLFTLLSSDSNRDLKPNLMNIKQENITSEETNSEFIDDERGNLAFIRNIHNYR